MDNRSGFCSQCGSALAANSVFCPACGQRVAAQTTAKETVQTIPPRDLKSEKAARRRPFVGVLMILAAVAIVVAVILMAIAQYNR